MSLPPSLMKQIGELFERGAALLAATDLSAKEKERVMLQLVTEGVPLVASINEFRFSQEEGHKEAELAAQLLAPTWSTTRAVDPAAARDAVKMARLILDFASQGPGDELPS